MNNFKVGDKVRLKSGKKFPNGEHTQVICDIRESDAFLEGKTLHHFDMLELAYLTPPAPPNPPHKHKDLIIAWANGAKIQILRGFDVWEDSPNPSWSVKCEYRLKPQKSQLDIEIENIESEMRKLAIRLNDLMGK